MNEAEIEKIYKMAGEVVLKMSFIRFMIDGIKAYIKEEIFKSLNDKANGLNEIRRKFAHELPLINSPVHVDEIFLSKRERRNPGWLDRLDGERINDLYASFINQYEEINKELDDIIDALKLSENKPRVIEVMESTASTAVVRNLFFKPPEENC